MTLGGVAPAIAAAWAGTSPVEALAALLGVAYVLLAIGQHRACWLAALASTVLYLQVFSAARLYMQAALQIYYIAVALYGWRAWRAAADGATLPVSRASWRVHALALAAVLLVSLASASWLAQATGSREPLLDSLTTWASVVATWLMARKKIENWAWWLVTDVLIAVLCWREHLLASMVLYGLYVGLALIGWRQWLLDLRRRAPAAGQGA